MPYYPTPKNSSRAVVSLGNETKRWGVDWKPHSGVGGEMTGVAFDPAVFFRAPPLGVRGGWVMGTPGEGVLIDSLSKAAAADWHGVQSSLSTYEKRTTKINNN